tara:strand:+ start:349 stop:510 length:162 start_codon:yes stop_codon:yes gene_type:complete
MGARLHELLAEQHDLLVGARGHLLDLAQPLEVALVHLHDARLQLRVALGQRLV